MRHVHVPVLATALLLPLATGCISTNDIVFDDAASPDEDDSGAPSGDDSGRGYPRDDAASPGSDVGATDSGSATDSSTPPPPPPDGKPKGPQLGTRDHTASSVTLTQIARSAQSL